MNNFILNKKELDTLKENFSDIYNCLIENDYIKKEKYIYNISANYNCFKDSLKYKKFKNTFEPSYNIHFPEINAFLKIDNYDFARFFNLLSETDPFYDFVYENNKIISIKLVDFRDNIVEIPIILDE